MGTERKISDLEAAPAHAEVLTVRHVAALTNRHEVTVRRALVSGELRGKQRSEGGRWSVLRSDALTWATGEAA